MSLRGVKKALQRTPHMLFGSKTDADDQVTCWQRDINSAIAGLEYLQLEAKQWHKLWETSAAVMVRVVDEYNDIHKPISLSEKRADDKNKEASTGEQFTYITQHELHEAHKMAKLLFDEVLTASKEEYESSNAKCGAMKTNLKAVAKLLTKREHKKVDYDMEFNTVDALLSGSKFNDKEQSKFQHAQSRMAQSKRVFENIDQKVRLVLPAVMETLSEFLNKLVLKIYYSNLAVLKLLVKNLNKFAVSQGLVYMEPLSYDAIVSQFTVAYSESENKLQHLGLLQDYTSLKDKTVAEKAVGTAGAVAGATISKAVDTSSALYTKVTKPKQKVSLKTMTLKDPVKTSRAEGMFGTSLDPLTISQWQIESDKESEAPEEDPDLDAKDSAKETTATATATTATTTTATTESTGNEDWMRPLALKSGMSTPVEPTSADRPLPETPTQPTSPSQTTSPSPRRSLFNLVEGTETARYTSVRIKTVRQAIAKAFTTPVLESAPITGDLPAFSESYRDYISARSTLTSQILGQD